MLTLGRKWPVALMPGAVMVAVHQLIIFVNPRTLRKPDPIKVVARSQRVPLRRSSRWKLLSCRRPMSDR